MTLEDRFRKLLKDGRLNLPLPGRGETALRHKLLAEIAREHLSLARLAEAHTDAVAILAEAGREPVPGVLYGVWAADAPHHPLHLDRTEAGFVLNGSKPFCTGSGLVDRALVTAVLPEQRLVDVDLRTEAGTTIFDTTAWIAHAFRDTNTATATFRNTAVADSNVIEGPRWYLDRPGFWHGACGPASCWAGGALGLMDHALKQSRHDPHTLAHLGAIAAESWALQAFLESAGREIDAEPTNCDSAITRALTLRHLVETACTDILHRFARTYGPRPLAFDLDASTRYQELELYLRQCHGERDLEELGRCFHTKSKR